MPSAFPIYVLLIRHAALHFVSTMLNIIIFSFHKLSFNKLFKLNIKDNKMMKESILEKVLQYLLAQPVFVLKLKCLVKKKKKKKKKKDQTFISNTVLSSMHGIFYQTCYFDSLHRSFNSRVT